MTPIEPDLSADYVRGAPPVEAACYVRVSRHSIKRMAEILDVGLHGNKTDAAEALVVVRNALNELLEKTR